MVRIIKRSSVAVALGALLAGGIIAPADGVNAAEYSTETTRGVPVQTISGARSEGISIAASRSPWIQPPAATFSCAADLCYIFITAMYGEANSSKSDPVRVSIDGAADKPRAANKVYSIKPQSDGKGVFESIQVQPLTRLELKSFAKARAIKVSVGNHTVFVINPSNFGLGRIKSTVAKKMVEVGA